MSAVDKYCQPYVEDPRPSRVKAITETGVPIVMAVITVTIASGDSDNSVYRLIKDLPSSAQIIDIKVGNTAITSGTDYDIGFHGVNYGTVVDKDILADGLNLSSAHAGGAELSGIGKVTADIRYKRVFELLGCTLANRQANYDLTLTANTVGSADGTVVVIVTYAEPSM